MVDLDGMTVLPDFVNEVRGTDGLIDVVRDYCAISHIESQALDRIYKIFQD